MIQIGDIYECRGTRYLVLYYDESNLMYSLMGFADGKATRTELPQQMLYTMRYVTNIFTL